MATRANRVVTIQDLKAYFSGEKWRMEELTDSAITVHSPYYDVKVSAKSFQFRVKIAAEDDPTDSEEKVTSDPLSFLEKFLSAGAGGSYSQVASSPKAFSRAISVLASKIERGEVSKQDCLKKLRRLMISSSAPVIEKMISFICRCAAEQDIEKEELMDMMKSMKSKGWDVSESEDTRTGLPIISVDISGIYTAAISIDSIAWTYRFEVRGYPESAHEGESADPRDEFRKFFRDPKVEEFWTKAKADSESSREQDTVAPKKKVDADAPTEKPESYDDEAETTKPSSREQETAAPPKRENYDNETVAPPKRR